MADGQILVGSLPRRAHALGGSIGGICDGFRQLIREIGLHLRNSILVLTTMLLTACEGVSVVVGFQLRLRAPVSLE